MAERLNGAVTILLAIAAVSVLVRDHRAAAGGPRTALPIALDGWEEVSKAGVWVGSQEADVVITSFVDYQCPFCATAHAVVDSLLAENPEAVAVSYVHYPLPNHSEALAAAIAVECAEQQSRAGVFIFHAFERQRDFPQHPWMEIAEEVGVPDLAQFESCMKLPVSSFPRIEAGIASAAELNVRGTPTMWVNGRPSTPPVLRRHVEDALRRIR